jgi:HEAT repeat protein
MTSATERMIAFHLSRLEDKNPEVRIKSIEELVLLEATQALDALEAVYRNDVDESVRLAAQKAGRTLFFKKKEQEEQPGSSGDD